MPKIGQELYDYVNALGRIEMIDHIRSGLQSSETKDYVSITRLLNEVENEERESLAVRAQRYAFKALEEFRTEK